MYVTGVLGSDDRLQYSSNGTAFLLSCGSHKEGITHHQNKINKTYLLSIMGLDNHEMNEMCHTFFFSNLSKFLQLKRIKIVICVEWVNRFNLLSSSFLPCPNMVCY